ncbi:MAG: PIN domain-containing protein [Anaerolineae bacterium]|nr:PIN domain-containing protein [Anaerolineae bacterium]
MMRQRVLVDSSFLFALYDQSSDRHEAAQSATQTLVALPIVPNVVLTEVTFLLRRAGSVPAVTRFLDAFVASRFELESVTLDTLRRARGIMADYADSRFDFVDCCIMALAEQLAITQVCTFDRRDFSIFRPTHCDYLDLLP